MLFVGSCLSLDLFNQFLIAKSWSGGPGTCFIRSLAKTFPTSSSLSREPTIGFSASKVEISSKTSSKGFCRLKIFLLIRSSFWWKLALLILFFFSRNGWCCSAYLLRSQKLQGCISAHRSLVCWNHLQFFHRNWIL